MKDPNEFLMSWPEREEHSIRKHVLRLIEEVQADAMKEIKSLCDTGNEILKRETAIIIERGTILAEKESWGNEFSAVVFMKDRVARLEALLDKAEETLEIIESNPTSDSHFIVNNENHWTRWAKSKASETLNTIKKAHKEGTR